jgi:hypothetical protein
VHVALSFIIEGNVPREAAERALQLSRDKYCSVWHSMRQDIDLLTRRPVIVTAVARGDDLDLAIVVGHDETGRGEAAGVRGIAHAHVRARAIHEQHGVVFPDTAPMAVHRGRIDLLEEHLRRDPKLLTRTFSHREIFPAEMGCTDEVNATVGTPLGGATLLHMCVDYDEMEMATWLLDKGMDVNARSAVGASGFGGYTALFSTVVSQPNFWMNLRQRGPFVAPFTSFLLDRTPRDETSPFLTYRKDEYPD